MNIGKTRDDFRRVFDVRSFAEHLTVTKDAATGVAPIIVDREGSSRSSRKSRKRRILSGRNSIIVILGANLLLNDDDLNRAEDVIRRSKVLVCQLEIRSSTVATALKLARKHSGRERRGFSFVFESIRSVLSILNPTPMSEKFDRELLKLADVICPNQSEVKRTNERKFRRERVFSSGGSSLRICDGKSRRCASSGEKTFGIRREKSDRYFGRRWSDRRVRPNRLRTRVD